MTKISLSEHVWNKNLLLFDNSTCFDEERGHANRTRSPQERLATLSGESVIAMAEAFSRMSVVRLAAQRKKIQLPHTPMKRSLKLLAALVAISLCRQTSAAIFNPNDVASLITAINTSNSNGEDDTIELATNTYTLTTISPTAPTACR